MNNDDKYISVIKRIFTDSWCDDKRCTTNDILSFIKTIITSDNKFMDKLKDLYSSDHQPDENRCKEFCNSLQLVVVKYSTVIDLILTLNDIMFEINARIPYTDDNILIKNTIGNKGKSLNSDSKHYTLLNVNERMLTMLLLTIITLSEFDVNIINTFLSKLTTTVKPSVYTKLHELYHYNNTPDDFKPCIYDLYVLMKICLMYAAYDLNVNNSCVMKVNNVEKCKLKPVDDNCIMSNFSNEGMWLTILQSGLYVNKLHQSMTKGGSVISKHNFDYTQYINFYDKQFNRLLELLGYICYEQRDYKMLYIIGYIFSMSYDKHKIPIVDDKGKVNNVLLTNRNNNVCCVGVRNNDGSIYYMVIEMIDDGKTFVYRDMNTTAELNVREIRKINTKGGCNKQRCVSTGGCLSLFNNTQMESSEILMGIIAIAFAILIIVVIVDRQKQKNHRKLGIDKTIGGKPYARIVGGLNENIPDKLIS